MWLIAMEITVHNDYPLVNCPITMEHHHFQWGFIHYFDWAMFNSELLNYQRVSLHWLWEVATEIVWVEAVQPLVENHPPKRWKRPIRI